MSDHLRILLDQTTSDQLTEAGGDAFLIVGTASHPSDPALWALHVVPVEKGLADKLCEIAMGRRKAGPRVKAPAPPPEAVSGSQGGKAGA